MGWWGPLGVSTACSAPPRTREGPAEPCAGPSAGFARSTPPAAPPRSTALRQRMFRSQLKRDPIGGSEG